MLGEVERHGDYDHAEEEEEEGVWGGGVRLCFAWGG